MTDDLLPFKHYQEALGDLPDLPEGIHKYIKFLFTEGGALDDTVTIAFIGSQGARVRLKLTGTGSSGAHLGVIDDDGAIGATATAYTDPLAAAEFGIALEDFADGDDVECDLHRN